MSHKPKTSGDQNIVIQEVEDQHISLNIDGKIKRIPNNLAELKRLMQDHNKAIQYGEKIYNIEEIGQAEFHTIINHYQQESKQSFYLRLFLLVFVPILGLTAAYLYYQYQVSQTPMNLTVTLKNLTPNPELPDPKGKLTLSYGDKSETQEIIKGETFFKGIPSNFKGKLIKLSFDAEGYLKQDTSFRLSHQTLTLAVRRNQDLAKIIGYIKDDSNNPLAGVSISTQNLKTTTDALGYFELNIPFAQQRVSQRLSIYKAGYQSKEISTPVIPGEPVRLILDKQ